MHSFISSSRAASGEPGVLRNIATAAIVALGFYAAVIALWSPDIHSGQDQESDVAIAVERFLYDGPVPDAAIVGSSQAARIPMSALGAGVANLALAGESPLAGLEIIARSGRIPRRLYIEMNNIGHAPGAAFIEAIFAEPLYTLKRFVKALRTTYQPANVVISLLRRAARGRDEVYYPKVADEPLHNTLLAHRQGLLAEAPDAALLERNLAEVKRFAAKFATGATDLVFFEMPIDPALEQSPAVVAVRRAAYAAFPPGAACWNDDKAPPGLTATDGIHLASDTAAGFWAKLAKTACRRPQPE
jgi:hypothetical protein